MALHISRVTASIVVLLASLFLTQESYSSIVIANNASTPMKGERCGGLFKGVGHSNLDIVNGIDSSNGNQILPLSGASDLQGVKSNCSSYGNNYFRYEWATQFDWRKAISVFNFSDGVGNYVWKLPIMNLCNGIILTEEGSLLSSHDRGGVKDGSELVVGGNFYTLGLDKDEGGALRAENVSSSCEANTNDDSGFCVPRKKGRPRIFSSRVKKKKVLAVLISNDSVSPEMVELVPVMDNSLILPEAQDSFGVLTRGRRASIMGKRLEARCCS